MTRANRPAWFFVAVAVSACSARLAAQESSNWGAVRQANAASVLLISVRATLANGLEERKTGTGVIVHPAGYVLTCSHLIPRGARFSSVEYLASIGRYEHAYPLKLVRWDD